MPKAILEFSLPEEQTDFELAQNGINWHLVAWDLDQVLRAKLKYGPRMSKHKAAAFNEIRNTLHELMSDHGVKFE